MSIFKRKKIENLDVNHETNNLEETRISFIGECDEPINDYNHDTLDLSDQIDGFADFIKTCDTPMTISIEGDWGSGKTSFYNAVKDTVNKTECKSSNEDSKTSNEKFIFVEFNAWQYSQFKRSDNLAIDLFYTIVKKIENDAKEKGDADTVALSQKAQVLLRGLGRFGQAALLSVANYITKSGLGIDAKEYYSDLKKSAEIREDIKKIGQLEPYGPDGIEIISTLKNDFQKCIKACLKIKDKKEKDSDEDNLKDTNKRLIVFVDDLDRLVPDKAVEILEALKIFLDCKYVVFILAIDYKVVVNGVTMKYKDSINKDKGKDFFEKIIQVVYKVPSTIEHSNMFIAKILKKHGIWPMVTQEFTDLLRTSGKDNPRAVKRVLNTFLLSRKIAEKQGRPSYEDEDVLYPNPDSDAYLFAFICLRESNEYLYNEFVKYSFDGNKMIMLLNQLDDLKNWLVINSPEIIKKYPVSEEALHNNYLIDIEKVNQSLEPLLERLDIRGNSVDNEKKREFLLTFFKVLMSDIGYERISSLEFLKARICENKYIYKIRSAMLLSDISGTNDSKIQTEYNISVISLYVDVTENEEVLIRDIEKEVIPILNEIGTTEDAYKTSLERLIPNAISDDKIDKIIQRYDFITNDPSKFKKNIELRCNYFNGLDKNRNQEVKTIILYSESACDSVLRTRLDTIAKDLCSYIEWYEGRYMRSRYHFGDSSYKDEYECNLDNA